MNADYFSHNLKSMAFQRNFCIALCMLLSFSVFLLSTWVFFKNERIVVCPPVIEKEFWVDSTSVSSTYLEQFGVFLGGLALGKSPHSAQAQRAILLRHVHPSFAPLLRKKLLEEEDLLKKQHIAYQFYPMNVHVDASTLKVKLIGERISFLGDQKASPKREGYVLSFCYDGGRLLLSGLESVEVSS